MFVTEHQTALNAAFDHPAVQPRSVADMAEHLRTHFGVARFDEWIIKAQPGARQIYGVGVFVAGACAPGVARRMRDLYDAGLITMCQRRARADVGFEFDYIAIRTKKPVPKGFPNLKAAVQQFSAVRRVGGK